MACKSPNPACVIESATEVAPEPAAHNAAHRNLDVELPCIDGMLMGTMALMTGYAEHQCEQGNPCSRNLMAKKIVSNLFFLAAHPNLSVPMAAVMRNLQKHWHTLSALTSLEASAALCTVKPISPASPLVKLPSRPDRATQSPVFWLPEQNTIQ